MVNAEQLKNQLDDLKITIESLINGVKDELISKISEIESKITHIETQADTNSKAISVLENLLDKNTNTINILSSRVDSLEAENKLLKGEITAEITNNFDKQVDELSEKIESRTNRQLRETLVIKGIPEVEGEDWEKTTEILATVISQNGNITYQNVRNLIKRAHREKPNEKRDGNRHIFAAMYSWTFSEELKKTFRLKNVRDRNFGITIESKYGPLTTWRRHKAMDERRKLKADNKIAGGFVAFPARLMVSYPNQFPLPVGQKVKYSMYKNFSNVPVVFDNQINV